MQNGWKWLGALTLLVSGCGIVPQTTSRAAGPMTGMASDSELRNDVAAFYHLMFAFIDTNHDGLLERPEAVAKGISDQGFDQMDANADGTLVFDEISPPSSINNGIAIVRNAAAEFFPDLDRDHDGQITLLEYQAGLVTFQSPLAAQEIPTIQADAWRIADQNNDGTLDADEFESVCGYVLGLGYRYTSADRRLMGSLMTRTPGLRLKVFGF